MYVIGVFYSHVTKGAWNVYY